MNRLYIGTFTSRKSQGIYYGTFDQGKLQIEGTYFVENPSYLAKHGEYLYAVSEVLDGEVLSFSLEKEGALTETSRRKVFGDSPCYVDIGQGRLYTANYSSGSISEFLMGKQGEIRFAPKLIVHYGHSTNKTRQSEPHVHQTILTPDEKQLAVCDLGIDSVCFYDIGSKGIKEEPKRFSTPKGMGPRHLCFGPEKRWEGYGEDATLIQETNAGQGGGKQSYGGTIRLSPQGDSLLCTVRGEDIITLFQVAEDGTLHNKQSYWAGGEWPRDAAFSPDGKYVLSALQYSGQVCVFEREKEKLRLIDTISIPGAACICF